MAQRTLYYFAVGGTGALSIEPLLHLCAAGLGPERLSILIIESDAGCPAVKRALGLIEAYDRVRSGFGSPAIGSILMHALRDSQLFAELMNSVVNDPSARAFAVGSIFGGTGAAALPVLAQLLHQKGLKDERIGAALVTPYYSLGVPPSEEE